MFLLPSVNLINSSFLLQRQKVNQCYGMGIECQESFFDIWWYDVPGSYYCKPITPHDNVYQACNRHFKLLPGGRTNGFVPCNVSRPFVSIYLLNIGQNRPLNLPFCNASSGQSLLLCAHKLKRKGAIKQCKENTTWVVSRIYLK